MTDTADAVIVGGGPSGSALGIRLADAGISTILLERAVEPQWRACGVFTSPLVRNQLIELGVPPGMVDRLARPIAAMNLQTVRGTTCRLTYEHGMARGFDRPELDRVLLERARTAGVDVRTGVAIRALELGDGARQPGRLTITPTVAGKHDDTRQLRATLVVGADGGSFVAGHAGVTSARRTPLAKSGLVCQRRDPQALPESEAMEARFVLGRGWYVGAAPVPRGRMNIGMVLPRRWLGSPPARIERSLLARFPGPRAPWMTGQLTDSHRAAGALGQAVSRAAGDGFVLVGDAAGFIDPLTGEGLHRAFVSSELAAVGIVAHLRGDRNALQVYDHRLRSRFMYKDVVSWILQAFLAQPHLMEYALARLARRARQRRIMTLVLTDQLPATKALDPRFLARLLAP